MTPIYKNHWSELVLVAFVLATISLLINIENPAGIVIVTSLASTALGLMVAPISHTNSIRSVFMSYILALFVAVTFGYLFAEYLENRIDNQQLLFFVEFFIMLSMTLLFFGFFDVYHPPSIGAMLAYFIDRGLGDADLIVILPLAVLFLLTTIKSYIYFRHPDKFNLETFKQEFKRARHA